MAQPIWHYLVAEKADGVLKASCTCGYWSLSDPDGDFVTAEYRKHKAHYAKAKR